MCNFIQFKYLAWPYSLLPQSKNARSDVESHITKDHVVTLKISIKYPNFPQKKKRDKRTPTQGRKFNQHCG